MTENLMCSLAVAMAQTETDGFIERATEQTTRWSPTEHRSLNSEGSIILSGAEVGWGPLSLSHLLDFFQVLRKIRVCTTPPQPQLVQIDKWTSSKEEDGTAPEKGCGVRRTGAEVAVSKGGMLLSHPLSQITSSSVQEKSKGKVGGLPGSPVTKRHTPKAGAQV